MTGWICPICNKELKPCGTRNSHMKLHRPLVIVSFVCTGCGSMVNVHSKSAKEGNKIANGMNGLCINCQVNNQGLLDGYEEVSE